MRRDIARLRDLGYPVDSTHGVGGGYRMEPGVSLPPLLFDLDEAIAVLNAASPAAGGEAPVGLASGLSKIEAAIPRRLRTGP